MSHAFCGPDPHHGISNGTAYPIIDGELEVTQHVGHQVAGFSSPQLEEPFGTRGIRYVPFAATDGVVPSLADVVNTPGAQYGSSESSDFG